MFSRLAEHDIRPTFFSKTQIDSGWRDVDKLVTMIEREVVVRLAFKLSQHLLIITLDPTCCRYVYRVELAFDFVFIAQAMRDHLELQRSDGTENEVVISHGLEKLRRALLTQLGKSLLQRFEAQRVFQRCTTEDLRREIRNTGEADLFTFGKNCRLC